MAKKIITYTLVAEMEINTNWYDEETDSAIKQSEMDRKREWIFDNIKTEKISIRKG